MKWLLLIIYVHGSGTPDQSWAMFNTVQECRNAYQQMLGASIATNQGQITAATCMATFGEGREDLR